MPDSQVAVIYDVDENRGQALVEKVESNLGLKPIWGNDFRDVLACKDIDTIVVATPDHWHAPITVYACMAGKDVYVENPHHTIPAKDAQPSKPLENTNVRSLSCGFDRQDVDDFQMRQIQLEIRRGMKAGGMGLSIRLDYIVQCFNSTDELVIAH